MTLSRPERHELRQIARDVGMNLGDADLEFFLPIIDANLGAYDRVAAFPVPRDVYAIRVRPALIRPPAVRKTRTAPGMCAPR